MRALDVRPHLSGCGQARRKRDPIQVDQELLQTEVQFELQPIIPVDVYTLDHPGYDHLLGRHAGDFKCGGPLQQIVVLVSDQLHLSLAFLQRFLRPAPRFSQFLAPLLLPLDDIVEELGRKGALSFQRVDDLPLEFQQVLLRPFTVLLRFSQEGLFAVQFTAVAYERHCVKNAHGARSFYS